MKKGRKIALIALMAVVALVGTVGGVALAQDEEEATSTTPETARFAYLERVCEIYYEETGVTIDVDILKNALCQAGQEKHEQVRNQFRQRLIDEDILTEEQLAEWEEWLQSRPDFPAEEFRNWMESRPDDLPRCFNFENQEGKRFAFGLGYHLGKGSCQGLGGWCQPGSGTE